MIALARINDNSLLIKKQTITGRSSGRNIRSIHGRGIIVSSASDEQNEKHSPSSSVVLEKGAKAIAAVLASITLLSAREVSAEVICNFVTPCTPPPPNGEPRYKLPSTQYDPAKIAEEKFMFELNAKKKMKEAAAVVIANDDKVEIVTVEDDVSKSSDVASDSEVAITDDEASTTNIDVVEGLGIAGEDNETSSSSSSSSSSSAND